MDNLNEKIPMTDEQVDEVSGGATIIAQKKFTCPVCNTQRYGHEKRTLNGQTICYPCLVKLKK